MAQYYLSTMSVPPNTSTFTRVVMGELSKLWLQQVLIWNGRHSKTTLSETYVNQLFPQCCNRPLKGNHVHLDHIAVRSVIKIGTRCFLLLSLIVLMVLTFCLQYLVGIFSSDLHGGVKFTLGLLNSQIVPSFQLLTRTVTKSQHRRGCTKRHSWFLRLTSGLKA